ncbi:MAG: circularly permuted type 2 ATP-grasp protein, partial [Dokdonella sp.]
VFLARTLGVPLVEGHDLTVRGDTAYIKTLGGLKRVHAILRRMDDDYCDPLELRGDSAIGVPGLIDVARAGRVLIANALGSGVLESPGLLGFLPRICERLLAQPLAIPSVATWWCGEGPVCAQALDQIERLVIKGAYPSQRFEPMFGHSLNAAQIAQLRVRILARPQAYVAQELVQLAQAPVWQGGGARARIAPRSAGMRVYAVATEHGYTVMPGGLTRIAGSAGAGIVSMQRGGASKDTWILAGAHDPFESLQRLEIRAADLVRRDHFLPSRLVENLFWLGRYCERADGTTRLLRVLLARYVDSGSTNPSFNAAVDACRSLGMLRGHSAIRRRLLAAVVDAEAPGSLSGTLARLFWSAAQVRGRLSQENSRALMELQRETAALQTEAIGLGDALDVLNRVLLATSALSGFAHDDMTRDDGWRFLMIARRLERLQFLADVVARVLRHPAVSDSATLEWLLELADCTITYRLRYLSSPQLIPTLDLVLCDPANPHSVLFQVQKLRRDLAALGDDALADGQRPLDVIEDRLSKCDLSALETSLLGASGRADAMLGLASLSGDAADASRAVSDRLTLKYFAHVDDISQPTVSA